LTDDPPLGERNADDRAIVLEAIDFMLGLNRLPPELRRRLDDVRTMVERFQDPSDASELL
jgi:hypothetical protein